MDVLTVPCRVVCSCNEILVTNFEILVTGRRNQQRVVSRQTFALDRERNLAYPQRGPRSDIELTNLLGYRVRI